MRKLILMTSLALTMILIANGATQTIGGYTWTYRIVDGGAEIYKGYESRAVSPEPTGDLILPLSLGEHPVTSIGDYAFYNCTGLESVTIPSSVTSVGKNAFYACYWLKSAAIPSGVTSIGEGAFSFCKGLTSVTIPDSMTNVSASAFYYCNGLKSVTIPSSVTSIDDMAFYGCSELASVAIPDGVASIGYYAFSGCSRLTSVTIPKGVTSIGKGAFSWCSELARVMISEDVTGICESAFCSCSGLEEFIVDSQNENYQSIDGLLLTKDGTILIAGVNGDVVIPSGVVRIGDYAFSYCSRRTTATIPYGVTSIGEGAFTGCTGLELVTIPSSVTSFGNCAFSGCGIRDVTVPGWKCGIDFTSVTNLVISEGTTSIGNSAFWDCCSLKSVAIPSSVRSVGSFAFGGCSGLTSVTMLSGVASIGDYAFYDCYNLKSVTIPLCVTSIGDYAFYRCSGLTAADFEGTPPEGLANAYFPKGIALRYNAAYADAWTPVISACGFTNATAYTPTSEPVEETVPDVSASEILSWVSQTLAPQFAALAGESQAAYCSRFTSAFGTDYAAAFRSETGKIGTGNAHLQVWHDYVAGTDPLETNSVFKAYIDSSNGVIQVKWSPDLNEEGTKSLRNYKIWGKESLEESPWQYPTNALHRFFKVTVEMP